VRKISIGKPKNGSSSTLTGQGATGRQVHLEARSRCHMTDKIILQYCMWVLFWSIPAVFRLSDQAHSIGLQEGRVHRPRNKISRPPTILIRVRSSGEKVATRPPRSRREILLRDLANAQKWGTSHPLRVWTIASEDDSMRGVL
jgi:hypothetical protein